MVCQPSRWLGYVRRARPGEYPPDIKPTHVKVIKIDASAGQQARQFRWSARPVYRRQGAADRRIDQPKPPIR